MFSIPSWRLEIDEAKVQRILTGESGPLGAALDRGMRKATTMAVANISNAGLVDSGKMRASVGYRILTDGRQLRGQVGVGRPYARFVHEGTPDRIYPRRAKVLRFQPKANRGMGKKGFVFAKSVRGIKPTPFLANARDALTLADFL